MICEIPPIPPARGYESSGTARLRPRYEDITQDGRVQLTSLMPSTGAIWRALDGDGRLDRMRVEGVLPILQRLVICSEPGPFSVNVPIECTGTWRLAREVDGERLFVNMWLEARAPHGSTLGPMPPADAERVVVGRIYVEHVVTKPFAPAAERKVTRLDIPGWPELPEDRQPFSPAEALIAGHPLAHVRDLRFGRMHTDSNQHVNSLVYPRLFEEALVFDAPDLMATAVEIRYRKPFFMGDRASLALAKVTGGAVGAFVPEGADKPSAAIAMRLG